MTTPMLSPQPRRRSLAELDARIAHAEVVQAERHAAVESNPVGKRAIALARMAVGLADERVTLLRQSRAAMTGEKPST